MLYKYKQIVVVFVFFFSFSSIFAQEKSIKGKIINIDNGTPLSYVPVYIVYSDGTKQTATTDFDGFYELKYQDIPDSLVVKFDNYKTKSIFLKHNFSEENNLSLVPLVEKTKEKSIEGVIIKKKKKYSNPAFEILEKLVARKPQNNPEKLTSYSYENYNRMEISMNNFGEKLEKRKVFRDIRGVMNAAKEVSGEDGKPIMPIFISENLSDYYYQKDPQKSAEFIKKTKVEGIGIEDGSMFSQLVTSTFIKYNFYNNYIRILGKDFLSPINDNFKLLYDYTLVNRNLIINDNGYYQIDYKPKRASDLAFEGTLYIAHGDYALFRVDAKVTPSANLNFINNLRIQQEMVNIFEENAWFPNKTRVFVETSKPGKESIGVFLKYYASAKNIVANKPIDPSKLEKEIVFLKDSSKEDDDFWAKNRHDSLTVAEKKMYGMIKEVKNFPSVRSYLDIIDLLLNGYYKMGKISLGPFLYTVGYNNHEGLRLRLGFKTNQNFSKKWILGGYLSYGFIDEKFKYGANIDYIISREPWTQTGISYSHDLGQVAFQYEDFAIRKNNIFDSFTKNGRMRLRRPFWQDTYQAYIQTDLLNSLTQKVTLKHFNFDPLFPFSYIDKDHPQPIKDFKTTEIIAETTWRPGRRILQTNNNKQINLKDNVYNPTITFRYTRGVKGIFGSDFSYNKFSLNIQQTVPMGILGRGEYSLTGGIIPNKVPYPLLENHLGNEFLFYNRYAFNMMRFFEFTSNRYASLQYTQNLEGLITNSLPLIKKWNWRNHVTFNYLIGDLDPSFSKNTGFNNLGLKSLNGKPYMEVGYGISNIFRFLRIDFIHRLTHLEETPHRPSIPKFSVKLSAQIRL